MDEENDNVEVLDTVDGTYIDTENKIDTEVILDSETIPEFTEEEADDREYENVDENSEGGL